LAPGVRLVYHRPAIAVAKRRAAYLSGGQGAGDGVSRELVPTRFSQLSTTANDESRPARETGIRDFSRSIGHCPEIGQVGRIDCNLRWSLPWHSRTCHGNKDRDLPPKRFRVVKLSDEDGLPAKAVRGAAVKAARVPSILTMTHCDVVIGSELTGSDPGFNFHWPLLSLELGRRCAAGVCRSTVWLPNRRDDWVPKQLHQGHPGVVIEIQNRTGRGRAASRANRTFRLFGEGSGEPTRSAFRISKAPPARAGVMLQVTPAGERVATRSMTTLCVLCTRSTRHRG